MYVELHARSSFSFLEGASTPEALAAACAAEAIPSIALLDRDGLYGSPRMHGAAQRLGLKAHVGAEVSLEDPLFGEAARCRYPLLVESRTGYQNLCRLITRYKLRERSKGEGATTTSELEEHASGLICLTGGAEGPLAEALIRGGYDEGLRCVERLTRTFGHRNVYVELQRHRRREQEARNQAAIGIARKLGLPLLATNGVCYASPKERQIQDVMTAIRLRTTLEGAGLHLDGNAERHLRSPKAMERLFADLPEAIRNTGDLSQRLQFQLKDLGYEFPRYPVGPGETMQSFLRARTAEGFRRRYGVKGAGLQRKAQAQIEHELNLIEKLNLAGYFLIVWDIIRFCEDENILVQGRGSAANSAVCYALGITAVDPVSMGLLFERFLSEERGEWPDIDLDLPSGSQREKVIQHLYRKYGREGAAMTANCITFRGKSSARQVGKVLGFEGEILSKISSLVGRWEWNDPAETLAAQFSQAGLDVRNRKIAQFLSLCLRMQDQPRHLGQHSGGMIVSAGLLSSVVPIEPATMSGRTVIQWDKDDCADLGLIKVDLLGLGMMAVLEDCRVLIPKHHGEPLDLAQLPPDDPAVFATLRKADTVGMFQIESRAQMSSLPRTRPEVFYHIVIQVALIRPGPIAGELVNPYILRRLGRAAIRYVHAALKPYLERTLGVPIFQEQILRMAMVVANFTGGEADELRRAMGSKRSHARMQAIEQKLRDGMTANGISLDAQEEILQAIRSFAEFGFPESHAASFALIAYASAYLKEHFLAAFTCALLNNQPMGFYSPATIVKDAQRHGLKVLPIDVNRSDWQCTLEASDDPVPEQQLRMGLCYVRGLRKAAGELIVLERQKGVYASVDDLARRVPELERDELVAIAGVGALNWTYREPEKKHRRAALWDAQRAAQSPGPLFDQLDIERRESPLERMTDEERIVADYRGTGVTLGPPALHYWREKLDQAGVTAACDLEGFADGTYVKIAGGVIARQRPGAAKGFLFMSLEDETGIANVIIRPDIYKKVQLTVTTESYLVVEGPLQNMDGTLSVKAVGVKPLHVTEAPVASRDFH